MSYPTRFGFKLQSVSINEGYNDSNYTHLMIHLEHLFSRDYQKN